MSARIRATAESPHSWVPELRIRRQGTGEIRAEGQFVLYWMIAFRRTHSNFALQRAVDWAADLKKPLVIFEPLRVGYRWASDRLHRFAIDGMADNAARVGAAGNRGVLYYPYVEPRADADKGLLLKLAEQACVVVTDDYPAFFLPRMIASIAPRLPARLELVDSNGLLPLRATTETFATAYAFRRFLQKELRTHLADAPRGDPLAGAKLPPLRALPEDIAQRWPPASAELLAGDAAALARLPLDHRVPAVHPRGGSSAALASTRRFFAKHLANYAAGANEPDEDARSGLSPYLHFGHISTHELLTALAQRESWKPERLSQSTAGKREGWWGMSAGAEAWLDELVTWRELGFNMASHRDDYDRYESLPDWARKTLEKHQRDPRPSVYALEEFEAAQTHDPLWNAAQRQLVREGRIHNYLRMLWGKKILEWSATPRDALDTMIELNNRFALDGRDPNSYSGIFWCLGRYDRAWGPERPIFGTVRYMSSENTARKLHVKQYLRRYAAAEAG